MPKGSQMKPVSREVEELGYLYRKGCPETEIATLAMLPDSTTGSTVDK